MDIYTDGAYSGLRKVGGWAFYIPELHIRVCGKVENTTNNRMELIGAIKALEFVDESNIEDKEIEPVRRHTYSFIWGTNLTVSHILYNIKIK